ncbi:hypothetical protein DAEQUDRAFT_764582 [Daedalea quercina L-15889]|uniref:Uncharacterized protein n=1 Tax=Daedalea quercina L-15889 TaxID=1314783 RepID=A0A165R7F8_9APHY|nr:hypothetical protein DAEQUDRAFT_764582 [Daedalea quercina L-15889]
MAPLPSFPPRWLSVAPTVTREELQQAGLLNDGVSQFVTQALQTIGEHPGLLKLSLNTFTAFSVLNVASTVTVVSPQYYLSEFEKLTYYHGVSHIPTKTTHGVFNPPLNSVWYMVAPEIRDKLKDRNIRYSAIQAARFVTHAEDRVLGQWGDIIDDVALELGPEAIDIDLEGTDVLGVAAGAAPEKSYPHGNGRTVFKAIYNYDKQSGPFSAKDDSGSLVFDGQGKMVGILHSSIARGGNSHITYATPAWWAAEQIKAQYPHAISTARPSERAHHRRLPHDLQYPPPHSFHFSFSSAVVFPAACTARGMMPLTSLWGRPAVRSVLTKVDYVLELSRDVD